MKEVGVATEGEPRQLGVWEVSRRQSESEDQQVSQKSKQNATKMIAKGLYFVQDLISSVSFRPTCFPFSQVYIYSSGSRLAQRLLFGNTSYGDLRKYLSGFFDTVVG